MSWKLGKKLMDDVTFTLIAVVLFLGSSSNSLAKEEPFKMGAVLSITGVAAFLGEPERNTCLLLRDRYNKEGGINGRPIELIVYDDASDNTKAFMAVKKLIEQDKVSVIQGPTTSAAAMAVIPFVQEKQVPILVPAVHRAISDPLKKWVFQVAPTVVQETEKMFDYMKKKGFQTIAILQVSDERGTTAKDALVELAPKYGIRVLKIETFATEDVDMTPQLTRIKAANPQVVVMAVASQACAIVAKNFRQLGMSQLLMAGTGFGNIKFAQLAGEAANGVVFPSHKTIVLDKISDSDPEKPVMVRYKNDIEGRFKDPVTVFGAEVHDGFEMAVMAMKKAGNDRAKIRDELERLGPYKGALGTRHFTSSDHCGFSLESLVMLEVWNGEFRLAK
jgi:branched-chain amino acid transport system substrate-binding protein